MTTREGRRVQAGRRASEDVGVTTRDHAGDRPDSQMAGLARRFPPRPAQECWPATSQRRGHMLARLFAPPFTADRDDMQSSRRTGLTKLVHWLEEQPGRTWQDRWLASGADAAGNLAWRELAAAWLRGTGWASGNPRTDFIALGRGILPLICGDVIRPSLAWLLSPETPKNLAAEMARSRDPAGFAALAMLSRADPASAATKDLAARRIAALLAAKGGMIAGITVGDCLELLAGLADGGSNTSPYFYQLLHALGTFPPAAPPTVRAFKTPGQLTVDQLVDRYPIACQPVRALIIDYLRERQPAVDHATLRSLSRTLAGLFWRDLEFRHPGISSLRLEPGVAAAWKHRVTVKTIRTTGPARQVTESVVPRHDGMNTLAMVRAFYLDIAQWAVSDPARWAPWAVPCPIRDEEMSRKKERSHRKSRMDQRTRERQDCRGPAGRPGRIPRRCVHRRRADAAPAGDDQERHQREGLGRGSRHWQAPRPHRRRAPRVLDLGRCGSSSPDRHPHRGTHRTFAPQLRAIPAARHRRASPAAADRPVQDRYRALAGHRTRAGRRAQRGHLPDPRQRRGRAAGGGL
jgi:hypothetical protein